MSLLQIAFQHTFETYTGARLSLWLRFQTLNHTRMMYCAGNSLLTSIFCLNLSLYKHAYSTSTSTCEDDVHNKWWMQRRDATWSNSHRLQQDNYGSFTSQNTHTHTTVTRSRSTRLELRTIRYHTGLSSQSQKSRWQLDGCSTVQNSTVRTRNGKAHPVKVHSLTKADEQGVTYKKPQRRSLTRGVACQRHPGQRS